VQFPHPPTSADAGYQVNATYSCASSGNASKTIGVWSPTNISSSPLSIPCSFSGPRLFQFGITDYYSDVQWSTSTNWPISTAPTVVTGSNNVKFATIGYNVNNLNSATVTVSYKHSQCPNASPSVQTYNITRTSDLPAPVFTAESPTSACGSTSGTVSVAPPAQAPSGYRWYSVPANALKINGGFYSSASAPLTTTTPSVTIQAGAQDGAVILYVSAVYPGGCSTVWGTRELKVAAAILPAPTIYDDLISAPGDPTIYLFTAPQYSGAIYNWYVGSTLIESTTNYTFRRYVPCRAFSSVSCTVTNACGTSAPSEVIRVAGGCKDTRVANFTVSPNPASSIVTIGVKNDANTKPATSSSAVSFNEIIIYDFSGNPVKRQKYANVKQGTINIGNLRTGTYYIEIRNGQFTEKQTLIIQQ
jgi:hypothetical protein